MTVDRASALGTGIVTDRLVLEPMKGAHADALFVPMQDDRIYRWISSVPPTSVERLRQFWDSPATSGSTSGQIALNWAVRRTRDGAYVGKVDAEVDAEVAGHVGYLFFPPFWGHGYATEAVRGLVAHLAGHGVREFHALVTQGNVASERVLVKAGFAFARVIPDNDTIRGIKFDDLEYISRASP